MLLRNDDAWLEDLPIPDIRNWRVVDEAGTDLGFVQILVVDRQNHAFEAVLSGANERFIADEVEIEDGIVRVMRPLRRMEEDSDQLSAMSPEFETSYHQHFEEAYGGGEWELDDFRSAYVFGREMASDADFAGRAFERAEEDLKAHYVTKSLQPPYEIVRGAVKRGYQLVHGTRPFEEGGLTREAKQTLDQSVGRKDDSRKAGAATSNVRPDARAD